MNCPRLWLTGYDSHVPTHIEYPDINLQQLFHQSQQKFPTNVFIQYNAESFTYHEVDVWISSLKNYLNENGVKKGDKVALVLPNIPQFVIAYYAILGIGAVVVAMNSRYTKEEFSHLVDQADVSFVICLESHLKTFTEIKETSAIEQIITTNIDDYLSLKKQLEKSKMAIGHSGSVAFLNAIKFFEDKQSKCIESVSPSDPAIFQFSGGTTGSPKPAIGVHQNIVANSIQFSKWCDLIPGEEVILAAIPLYHVYGMVLGMNMGVAVGAKIVLISDPTNVENILIQIDTQNVTFYPGVPTMYHAINMNELAQKGEYKLGSIKACISGSFALHPQIKAEFEKLTGGKLIEGYGLSEAPTATHCNPLYGENKTGSIGLPLPDVEAAIVDVDSGDKFLDIGEVGELIIRGPQIMRGYYKQPKETAIALKDGWLHTGDIAKMDNEGYFYIIDRKKSLIKVNGLQVWPNEVEAVINACPQIKECGVGGVPDKEHGERVICWTVYEGGDVLDGEEITLWCKRKLSGYKIPKEYIAIDKLPRTGVGKILRRELINNYKKSADF